MGYSPWGCKELDMTEYACIHTIYTIVCEDTFEMLYLLYSVSVSYRRDPDAQRCLSKSPQVCQLVSCSSGFKA